MKKNTIAMFVVMGAGLLILAALFGRVIVHPGSYLFSDSGDAVKSYFNFSYYLKYDSGIRHDGINYPYGDHLQYINCHPLYLQIIRLLDRIGLPLSEHGVGILNLTMIFSLFLALPFLFLILRKFSLPPWYAAVVSLFILFLSPQLDRLGGHFEMVYAFFIPAYWYLLIRWHEASRKVRWSLLLLTTALVGGFTSAYYAAFLAIFPFSVLLVQLWIHRRELKGYMPEGFHLLMVAILPLIIVKGFANITDWVDDRPDNPWGFFIFHSNLLSIFLPPGSALQELTRGIIDMGYTWEGRSYVGLPGTLLALSFLLTLLIQLAGREHPRTRAYFPDRKLNLYLAASVIVLLFSMCIPFRWGLGFLTELLPVLKQFRCLGRFAWIFYYIFTVFTATYLYYLYRIARRKGYRAASLALLLIMLSWWGVEAASHVRKSTGNLFNANNLFTENSGITRELLETAGINADEYQGIFFLPFANSSGDKLRFERGLGAFNGAMKYSFQTGIPLIQSYSPRISLSQAMSCIQLLADSTIHKQRVDDMNPKPVLLVAIPGELDAREQALYERAEILCSEDQFSLARLPVQAFNRGFDSWVKLANSLRDSLTCTGGICSDVPLEKLIYNDFERYDGDNVFTGSGARYLKKGSMELFRENLYDRSQETEVELSFWLYVDHRTDNMPVPELSEWDAVGQLLRKMQLNSREVHNVDGMWVRISQTILPEPGVQYRLIINGNRITVDDLLVKPVGAHVEVTRENGDHLLDNFRVPVATDP